MSIMDLQLLWPQLLHPKGYLPLPSISHRKVIAEASDNSSVGYLSHLRSLDPVPLIVNEFRRTSTPQTTVNNVFHSGNSGGGESEAWRRSHLQCFQGLTQVCRDADNYRTRNTTSTLQQFLKYNWNVLDWQTIRLRGHMTRLTSNLYHEWQKSMVVI